MDKKVNDKLRSYNGKKKGKKQFFLILLISVVLLVGGTTIKAFASLRTTQTIELFSREFYITMILNNPISSRFKEEIKRVEEKNIRDKVDAIRSIDKKKKDEAKELKRLEDEAKEVKRLKDEVDEKNQKIAYLTFDDGPSKNITPRILDILAEYDIKATFFVLGKMVDLHPEMLKRTHDEGHAIGHHSYSHDYNYIYKNTENFIGELNETSKLFKSILGEEFETKLLRFPGGSHESKKQKFIVATEKLGYINYNWNVLNGDAEGNNKSREYLLNRLKSLVNKNIDEKEIIILMHDTDTKSTTADTLPEVIDFLIKEGYVFRTLNEK